MEVPTTAANTKTHNTTNQEHLWNSKRMCIIQNNGEKSSDFYMKKEIKK